MTVSEIIAELQKCDRQEKVYVKCNSCHYGSTAADTTFKVVSVPGGVEIQINAGGWEK